MEVLLINALSKTSHTPYPPYRRHTAVGGRSGERGQEAYAHKGLPCKDGYIRDVDDVRKKSPKKRCKNFH